jgi:hypothetical protein
MPLECLWRGESYRGGFGRCFQLMNIMCVVLRCCTLVCLSKPWLFVSMATICIPNFVINYLLGLKFNLINEATTLLILKY